MFEGLSDFVIVEIATWLVARQGRKASPFPEKKQIKDVMAFGGTCRRIRKIIESPLIWSCVDLGAACPPDRNERFLVDFLKFPRAISACQSLSIRFLKDLETVRLLIISMPRLRDLTVTLGMELEIGSEQKEQHTAVISAIESLGHLESLTIFTSGDIPGTFRSLPALRSMSLYMSTGREVDGAFTASCAPNVSQLWISRGSFLALESAHARI